MDLREQLLRLGKNYAEGQAKELADKSSEFNEELLKIADEIKQVQEPIEKDTNVIYGVEIDVRYYLLELPLDAPLFETEDGAYILHGGMWYRAEKKLKDAKQGCFSTITAMKYLNTEAAETLKSYAERPHTEKEKTRYVLCGRRLFRELCAENGLFITQNGNITFGDWWSVDIEPHHPNKTCDNVMTKENYLRIIKEVKEWIAEKQPKKPTVKKISVSYPKVRWLNAWADEKPVKMKCDECKEDMTEAEYKKGKGLCEKCIEKIN